MIEYEWDEPVPGYTATGKAVTVNRVLRMTRKGIIAHMSYVYTMKNRPIPSTNDLIKDFVAIHGARKVTA